MDEASIVLSVMGKDSERKKNGCKEETEVTKPTLSTRMWKKNLLKNQTKAKRQTLSQVKNVCILYWQIHQGVMTKILSASYKNELSSVEVQSNGPSG